MIKCELGTKYCFEQDEDCHWYLIKWDDKKLFNELLYEEDQDDYEKFGSYFEKYRIGQHISNIYFYGPNNEE